MMSIQVQMPKESEKSKHIVRIGVSSLGTSVDSLGEEECSYGYGGTGKASSGGRFTSYGRTFGVGQQVGCAVDLQSKPGTISYTL